MVARADLATRSVVNRPERSIAGITSLRGRRLIEAAEGRVYDFQLTRKGRLPRGGLARRVGRCSASKAPDEVPLGHTAWPLAA